MALHRFESGSTLQLLYLASILVMVSYHILEPLIPLYFKEGLGAPLEIVGLLVSLLFLSAAAWKILITVFLRIRRASAAFLIGCALLAASPILYLSSNSTLWVGVIRVLHGLGLSLFIISGLSLATLISTKEKIRSIGIFTLTASLGMMIGPGVASLGVRFLGFRGAFLLSMIASSMACVFSLVILRRFRGDPGLEESRASLKTILQTVGSRYFQMAFWCLFSLSFFYGVVIAYAPVHLKTTYDLEANVVALVFFLYSSASVVSRFLTPRIISLISTRGTLIAGFVNMMLMAVSLYLLKDIVSFSAALVIAGFSHGVVFPTAAIMISDMISPATLTAANAVYLLAFDIGAMLGPVATLNIVSKYGIPSAILSASTPAFILVLILAISLTVRDWEKG